MNYTSADMVLAIGVDALQNSEPGRGKHGGGDVLVNGLGRGENRLRLLLRLGQGAPPREKCVGVHLCGFDKLCDENWHTDGQIQR